MFTRATLTFFFFICVLKFGCGDNEVGVQKSGQKSFYSVLENVLEAKASEYTSSFTSMLEGFNDRHLRDTALGRTLHYEEMKKQLDAESGRTRSKKVAMTLMPLLFHVGASSTWMLVTAIMAAKSVAIGLTLLVFKIAVSSAKLASWFTVLKEKHHHHGWHEHHGHDSF